MSKKSCTYCDTPGHQISQCPHLPHGDANRVEKRAKVVVCGIGITYNPNSPKNRIHKVQGALLLRLEQSIDAMHKRFTESEDMAGVGLADAAKRNITVALETPSTPNKG